MLTDTVNKLSPAMIAISQVEGGLLCLHSKEGLCRAAPKRKLAARLEMALDVARGMAALEENDPPIVHRDLKPTNIFIDAGESSLTLPHDTHLQHVAMDTPASLSPLYTQ